MKIYLSGRITGKKRYKEDFAEAERFVRKAGHQVINPSLFDDCRSWEEYMKKDLSELMKCDAIIMLKGWRKSRGARLEHRIAKALKLNITYDFQIIRMD